MAGENSASAEATKLNTSEEGATKQRSTIAFPYAPLGDTIELAEAIHGNVGLGECDDDQLAVWTKQSPKSSGFRVQIASARLFGLITSPAGGKYRLADLGSAIVDPNQTREARANAFLNVPLYRAIFDKYRGGVLPGQAAAMEREIVALGVSDKVKDRARQVFERSAEQAGFFAHGRNRLVMPGFAARQADAAPPPPPPADEPQDEKKKGGNGGGFDGHDPLIIGLFQKLPEPEADWPVAARLKWLQTAANIFDLLYKGDGGGISMSAARAERSPRPQHDD
ncbi:hypothetical protein [Rhodoplanes sp. Z2-YC6860]|uniref:hypothetical protein n=1 Tax=Rhodoplanes sp. Z2-YC6860 TaxID=674703 RepID=UPI00078EE474|nr:hypothetical protein [Rhodoplanes sp. Z2-YC6860]AMN43231.1 hypothetical protein RHPLAN_48070 [Rhodoplanes sp. Z2-YC6860]